MHFEVYQAVIFHVSSSVHTARVAKIFFFHMMAQMLIVKNVCLLECVFQTSQMYLSTLFHRTLSFKVENA